jgi:hypothetical protein
VTEEQRRRRPLETKTLRAVDLLAEGFVARSLQIHEGYARRSRLALGQNLSPHSSVISAIKH